jgi:hypothetical protein
MAGEKAKGSKKNRKHGRGARNGVRIRYWSSNRLMKRKVKNLMRCCGMTRAEAEAHWREVRVKRIK